MSHTVTPPVTPNAGEKPSFPRPKHILLGCLAAVVLGDVAFSAWAVVFPSQMPAPVGAIVEDLTGANPNPVVLSRPPVAPLSAVAQLGQKIFFDESLSGSGKQSCASCHSPDHAYGPPNKLSVQLGGPHMNLAGYRPPPSLMYLYLQPNFSIGHDAGEAEAPPDFAALASQAAGTARAQKNAGAAPAAPAMVPQGGFFWDGRADTLQAQASGPMLNAVEMANTSLDDVSAKLQRTAYMGDFKQ